ncbi:MAG: TonB-dependent receptor, partial [Bacteroidota bacterium]|nr:TonB-dependent receptor [Bacteroidota bacterium]
MLKIYLLLFAFFMVTFLGYSQVTTSGMNGKITDANNESLPGATVVAVHQPSGTQYGTISNSEGRFTLQGMRSGGPYKVEVSFVGYNKATYTDVNLFLGESFGLNVVLKEESFDVGEVIVVGAKPSAFSTEKTGAATNISREAINTMPSISRSISDFTRMSPLAGGNNSFAGRDGRLNNINIDGANFNNNFGLSSNNMPGGDAQPISLDAIEEVQVNIAPYDVRQANFTGAGINAVTKSGTNTFTGSVYTYYRDQSFNGDKVGSETLPEAAKTSTKIIGGRIGGPIIKNKLFFFVNGEYEDSPSPGMPWVATRNGNTGTNVSRVKAEDLDAFSALLKSKFGYETGPYENYGSFGSKNHKILARVDWNINQQHKFSVRYNTVRNTNDQLVNGTSAPNPRASSNRTSNNAMSYKNSNYAFLNTVQSLAAELNSNFGGKFSNQLLATYTNIQDSRSTGSDVFPFIDIWDGSGNAYMSAGYELFSYKNDVLNNVFTITDNFTYYLGKHTLTAGASYEQLYFGNSFVRYGTSYYRFKDLQSFTNHVNGVDGVNPTAFAITYSLIPGGEDPIAELTFGQFSSYLQDEFNVNQKLKLTAGVRIDLPIYLNDLIDNPSVSALTFGGGEKLNLGLWPESKILWSPRVGFNYDVKGDKSLKVRGGTGIFTGRLPFVFFTNQPTNSGMIQNTVEVTSAASLTGIKFSPDPKANLSNTTLFPTTAGTKAPGSLASVAQDFKMPQVWRSNLAADIKLPLDMMLTLEGLYTKDLNAIIQRDANLDPSGAVDHYVGPDQRPVWQTAKRRVVSSISNAMVLDNTDEGYSYSLTAQLTFPLINNMNGMVAYTNAMSKDISGNPGSQASSAWSNNPSVRGQNDLDLSYSQYMTPHRVVGSLSYRLNYAKNFASTFSLFYSGFNAGNFSYRYTADFNNDGVNADLLYIPKDASEITFADILNTDKTVRHTAAAQAEAFSKYVDQDKYLSKHKGEYAERNGAFAPWVNRFDFKFMQDFKIMVKGQKNTLQFSCDILNASNLLNSDWGVAKQLVVSNAAILRPVSPLANSIPKFQMAEVNNNLPTETFQNTLSTASTYRIQIGLRYIFN